METPNEDTTLTRRGPDDLSAGKDDLVEFVSRDLDTTKQDARLIVDSVTRGIADLTRRYGAMRVPLLGNFRTAETGAREGRNPRTGAPVPIGPGRRVTFRAAKSFKNIINRRTG